MGSLIEMLATKKKAPLAAPESTVILPVLHREHEGSCGESCGCADGGEEGGRRKRIRTPLKRRDS